MAEKELHELSREELEMHFMRTLSWYFGEKRWPTGFFNSMPERVEDVGNRLKELNQQLAANSASQEKMAKALNAFTFLLVVVGTIQIYLRF